MTYSLIVSWPRMKWYILLASVSGLKNTMEMTRSNALKISAFCDGGRGGDEFINVLRTSLPKASTKRIGKMVNVYKNESRQRTKPKIMI